MIFYTVTVVMYISILENGGMFYDEKNDFLLTMTRVLMFAVGDSPLLARDVGDSSNLETVNNETISALSNIQKMSAT